MKGDRWINGLFGLEKENIRADFFLSELDKTEFLFLKMVETCMYLLINRLGAYVAKIVLAAPQVFLMGY